ncbi:MAG: hypothetical protein JNL50_09860 [Phycisphaerae bacterium]|nr:hypothetical protein [Phycisphaerae bacterium]
MSKHSGRRPGSRVRSQGERGVASVLSMMFLVMFGSLATAMAIASRGNIRTAATHLHVSRAQSAAETGMQVACKRLAEAAARFVVSKSDVDETYGSQLWTGDLSGTGEYVVLPAPSGYAEGSDPSGIAEALANAHAADLNIVTGVGVDAPTIAGAPALNDASDYAEENWLFTPPVALEAMAENGAPPPAFSVVYAPLANGTDIRVIVTGFDFRDGTTSNPISRTIMQDFRLAKKVDQAVVAPSRVMIGKNVNVVGDLGARFTDVTRTDGDPLVLRSDFAGLNGTLDEKLEDFFASLAEKDVDGDNRLRVGHPIESTGIPSNTEDYDDDGEPDGAFTDVTGDGFVDEFDIFINHYDTDGNGKVVLSAALTDGTPNDGRSPEFEDDDALAYLLDAAMPDRNKNGVYGFDDENRSGKWDAGEAMYDYDATHELFRDQVLGYRDGVIDKKDAYAKVRGRLVFKTSESAWTTAQGQIDPKLRGPIRPGAGESPQTYQADDTLLPDLTPDSFADATDALHDAANGNTFAAQVASNLGVAENALATYEETKDAGSSEPRFLRLDADNDNDSRPDNWSTAYYERMPFNSPSFSDYYYRPVYENMVFKDVVIPAGNNGLFKNCTFVGVTRVESYTSNTHRLWGEYGKMQIDTSTGRPGPSPARSIYGDSGSETSYPTMLPESAKPPNQMILMSATPLDKADIPANMAGGAGYDSLPEPLVINGKRVTDTKRFSNNLRFHDSLFVGSIVSDAPTNYTQSRNKLQFTGATRFTQTHPDRPEDADLNPQEEDVEEIAKSSMMLPQYSVDIGTFNSPTSQDVKLSGAIIAGVLDVRGNTDIDGVLLMTFKPVYGEAPLIDALGNPAGNPANFNTTIGYFGPDDGDEESLDPNDLPVVDGEKIVGWDLDGDGLADLGPNETPTDAQKAAGATTVPFYGYGHITIRMNSTMKLPDGIMLPMSIVSIPSSYREGHP